MTDEKTEAQETSAEIPATDSVEKAEAKESTEEKFEAEEDRSIPYVRFKEKVMETKDLKKAIAKLEAEKEQIGKDTAAQYEAYYEPQLAKLARDKEADVEETYDYDDTATIDKKISPLMGEVTALKEQLKTMQSANAKEKLVTQINSLKTVYPEMDEEHTYVTKKMKPDWTLEECAEHSHKHFSEKVNSRYNKMMEGKKAAAKKPVFSSDGRLNIKQEATPKTFKEAKKRMVEYARQLGEE